MIVEIQLVLQDWRRVMLDRIIQKFGLHVVNTDEVEDSFSSTVYKLALSNGENVYVKIPYSKLKYERELEAYEILQGRISTPQLLDHWAGDEECTGAFLLSELKGRPLSVSDGPEIAYQVGVLQAKMHSVEPPEGKVLKGIDNEFPNWSSFLDEKFYSFAEDVKKVVDASLFDAAIEKYKEMKQHLPSPDGPSFVHMDFRPGNIIVNDLGVVGVIDFESVRFGSTEIDFTKLHRDYLYVDDQVFKAFQEGYRSVRPLIDLEVVLPFYQFTDAFNSIGWCCRRGIDKHRKFYEENVERVKKWVF